MGSVGRIDLAIDAQELTAPCSLSHGVLEPGQYARITVTDTGRGISEADLKRIFEPFFTTRPAGSGLGLATAREIVLEHLGAMNVCSTVGVGSRFEVWLPRTGEVAPKSDDGNQASAFGAGEC